MPKTKPLTVESPIGQRKADSTGSPVGVVRMDVDKSYAEVGELLQKFLNDSDQAAWDRIAGKIDYTFENLDLAMRPLAEATGLGNEIRSRLDKGSEGCSSSPTLSIPRTSIPRRMARASGTRLVRSGPSWPP